MERSLAVRGVCVSPTGPAQLVRFPRGGDVGLRFLQGCVGGAVAALPIRYVGDGSPWGTLWFNEEGALREAPGVSPILSMIAPLFVVSADVLFGTVVVTGRPTPDGECEPIDDFVEQIIARYSTHT